MATNSLYERQQPVDKRQKRNPKQPSPNSKVATSLGVGVPSDSQSELSEPERSVLRVFRRYLMTPGRMLCFSRPDMETYKVPLARLIHGRLLFAEKFPGGYSLTETGYAAMKADA